MQKIVTIGGGTGHFQLLKGLKNYDCELTAIVGIVDDGGSSGKLRDEYGILPPGDMRQCMVALAPEDDNRILRRLFTYRFKDGHNLGNLIITAASDICGGEMEGLRVASRILNIQGSVLPVSTDHCRIAAETMTGETIVGEHRFDAIPNRETRIKRIWLEPRAHLYKEAAQKIREADKIILCPGDLYGSLLPHFLIEGMSDALRETSATIIHVTNLFTKNGYFGFRASDFLNEIEKYSGVKPAHLIVNTYQPPPEIIQKYGMETSYVVEDDLGNDPRVIRGEFAQIYDSTPNPILRHVPEKVARTIMQIPLHK